MPHYIVALDCGPYFSMHYPFSPQDTLKRKIGTQYSVEEPEVQTSLKSYPTSYSAHVMCHWVGSNHSDPMGEWWPQCPVLNSPALLLYIHACGFFLWSQSILQLVFLFPCCLWFFLAYARDLKSEAKSVCLQKLCSSYPLKPCAPFLP